MGLSIAIIDGTNGKVKSESNIVFTEIQEKIGDKKSDGTPVYSQAAPAMQLLDIVNVAGKSYYLCESYISKDRQYTKPSSTPQSIDNIFYYTQIEFMDYYLLDVSNPVANTKRVWKQSRTVELELGSFGGPSSARYKLLRNGLFSYQGMHKDKILTRGYGQMHNFYTLIDPVKAKEDLSQRIYWGSPINTLDISVFPQRKTYNVSFVKTYIDAYFSDEGILKTGDSFTLYQYDYKTNKLQLSKLKF